jgi:adenosine deaminase
MRSLLQQMPKVDLHRHLEGSLRLQTLADIAMEHGIDLPGKSIEELRPYVQVTEETTDFHSFLAKFKLLRQMYQTKEAVERIAYEAVADAANDNIRYLELRFNPVALSQAQDFRLSDVTDWVCQTVKGAQEELDIVVRLILQIGRDESLQVADEIIDIAITHRSQGVVGVDLAGDEVNYPPHRFADSFTRARDAGLGITIHAGEAGGAENVGDSIRLLHAARIGHGIRTVENSNVIRLVKEQGITLEVCPTSNFQTGVVSRLNQHPVLDLVMLGLPVTLNTDDPSISDITLTDEYMVVLMAIGLEVKHIRQAIHQAIEAAFLTDEEREQVRGMFLEWDQLGDLA